MPTAGLLRTTIKLVGVVALLPGIASADVIVTPRVSYYFDNFNSLNSSVTGDPPYVKNMVDALGAQLKAALGPSANVALTSSDITQRSQAAAYKLYGFSVDGRWGEGNRLYTTFLTGTANVQTLLSQQSIATLSYLGSTAQDVWNSSEATNSALRRIDVEVVYERNAFTAGVRFERVKQHFVGEQTTVISQNFYNMLAALANVQQNFGLESLQGTSQGDITYNVYSARMGVSLHTAKTETAKNDFTLSAQLQVSYSPAAFGRAVLAAAGQTSQPFTIQGTTDSSVSAGPDVSVGYTFHFARNAGLDLRYRTIVYFPVRGELSGTQKSSDPRVNHGLNVGISFLL